MLIFFPINKGNCKWYVLRTLEKDVMPSVFDALTAMVAMRGERTMEALPIFSCGGMAGDGASHAADGLNVVT